MEERDFFTETPQTKPAKLRCTHCGAEGDYSLVWMVRTKKPSLPPRASAEDRARFAKFRSYMVRRDDKISCTNPRCRKTFEVSGLQSIAFLP